MERFWSQLFARLTQAVRQRPGDEFAANVPYANGNEDAETTWYDYIRSRRFGRRLLRGLKPEEVTAFLDEVAEAFRTTERAFRTTERMKIKMEAQVRLLEDKVQALTIKQAAVMPSDAFKGTQLQATSPIRQDEQKNGAAASRLEVLRSTALQEVEALLHDAQARAQALTDAAHEGAAAILREADALKSHRQKEAEELLTKATATAEAILMTARDQEAALRHELDRLAEGRLRMLDDLWATLNACHEWLATVDPRRRVPEERDVSSESVTSAPLATGDWTEVG
jgi:DivIVA domain-containing protein